MDITQYYLALSGVLFSIGALGVFIRKNAIVVFMCIELMLNAVNLSFIAIARNYGLADGQVYVFFVMAVAACEAAVGLAIIISVYRNFRTINIDDISTLKG